MTGDNGIRVGLLPQSTDDEFVACPSSSPGTPGTPGTPGSSDHDKRLSSSSSPSLQSSSSSSATSNVIITAIGAGVLSLPRAMSTVGVFVGLFLVFVVALCTYACGMTIVREAKRLHERSYGSLVKGAFGPAAYALLQTSIAVHVFGVMVAYISIMRDVMCSVLEFVVAKPVENPNAVVAAFIAVCLVPMLLTRDLRRLGRFSRASVGLILFFSGTLVSLCGIALVRNPSETGIRDVVLIPREFGLQEVRNTLTSFAVLALSFTCHFNLLPIAQSMRGHGGILHEGEYTDGMRGTMMKAMVFVGIVYGSVATAGYCLFADAVHGDVMKSISIGYAAEHFGVPAAVVIGLSGVCYCIALCCNFTLKLWALRSTMVEAVLGKSDVDELDTTRFYAISGLLLVLSVMVSVMMPSIFTINAVIGSTACAVFSYYFPGRLLAKEGKTVQGAGFCLLAVVLAVSGMYHALFEDHA